MQLNRNDSECAYLFALHFIYFLRAQSQSHYQIRLSQKKIVVIQTFFLNRIWQSNKGFCAFRLFPCRVKSSSLVLWEAYISGANYNPNTSLLPCGGNRKYQLLTKTQRAWSADYVQPWQILGMGLYFLSWLSYCGYSLTFNLVINFRKKPQKTT